MFKSIRMVEPILQNSSELRKVLVRRERSLRKALKDYSLPSISYYMGTGNGTLSVSISRTHGMKEYKDFQFKLIVPVPINLETVERFQDGIFLRLLSEDLLLGYLKPYNKLYESICYNNNLPYSLVLTVDTFDDKYVHSISDNELVITVDSESLLELVDLVENRFDLLKEDEESALMLCQSTIELLGRRSPILSRLMNVGNLSLAKILKPSYNKTYKQLQVYPSATGVGYYLKDNVFGVVNRVEVGVVDLVVSPINLKTYIEDTSIDLLEGLNNE